MGSLVGTLAAHERQKMSDLSSTIGLDETALQRRAERAGIATEFVSFWGERQAVSSQVIAKVLDVMGAHAETTAEEAVVLPHGEPAQIPLAGEGEWRLHTEEGEGPAVAEGQGAVVDLPDTLPSGYYLLHALGRVRQVIIAPRACWLPTGLQTGERWWGITTQMYALRSERNWGIGDFTDLRTLIGIAAARGAAFVGISPLHALRTEWPEQASPYSPSSRLALNVLYIDPMAVPEFAQCKAAQHLLADAGFQQRICAVRASPTVRYAEVTALKETVFAHLWEHFCDTEWKRGTERGREFDSFMAQHEDTLGLHARYEAIQQVQGLADPSVWGWPAWPEALRDPNGSAARAFAQEHPDAVAYRYWLQWLAHGQLEGASRQARESLALGLYCDLAVGAADGGSETWMTPGLYARGMNIGAPPDPLSAQGQDWGLPPVNPAALAAERFLPFRRLLASVMRHASAVRIDHAMALMRLYWNSAEGGTYVHYPMQALMAVLAIESHRHHCMVIGEDLGNVAPRMREAMAQHGLLSYRPLIFERVEGGAFRAPQDWLPQALAVVGTHDLPTLSGFWSGDDIAIRQSMGWLGDSEAQLRAQIERAQDRTYLLAALNAQGLLPDGVTPDAQSAPEMTPSLAAAVHTLLARTPCLLMGVQLEDLTGQREQINVPGTTEDQYPNWRQRMRLNLEQLPGDPWFEAISGAVAPTRHSAMPEAAVAAPLPPLSTAEVPLATYRVQLNKSFTFAQAAQTVPYLHALGVSHLYASPYLKAAQGSMHGYDVVDPLQINPEIGTEEDHTALCETLSNHGMSQLLDIVPNHMGVDDPGNLWWQDVLEHGESSPHAAAFDIEWQPVNPQTGRRVLLPVLGDHYGKLLEAGELRLQYDGERGRLEVAYWQRAFPLDPRSYTAVLRSVPLPATESQQEAAEVSSLLDAFGQLPDRATEMPQERAARLRDAALYQGGGAFFPPRPPLGAAMAAGMPRRHQRPPGGADEF